MKLFPAFAGIVAEHGIQLFGRDYLDRIGKTESLDWPSRRTRLFERAR
jgi:hypothetical protein